MTVTATIQCPDRIWPQIAAAIYARHDWEVAIDWTSNLDETAPPSRSEARMLHQPDAWPQYGTGANKQAAVNAALTQAGGNMTAARMILGITAGEFGIYHRMRLPR